MRYFIYLLVAACFFSCGNSAQPQPIVPNAPIVSERPKVALLPLLTKELEKDEWNAELPFGFLFSETRKTLLARVASLKNDSLTVMENRGWEHHGYWQVDMRYIPEATPTDTFLLSAYNSDRLLMDIVIQRPIASVLSPPLYVDQAEVDSRNKFVARQKDELIKKYGQPDAVVDSFYIPISFGTKTSRAYMGYAYFWMRQNQMITLVDVALYSAVIYTSSPDAVPSAAQMMVISNAYLKEMVDNLWDIDAPTETWRAHDFSENMKSKGFILTHKDGVFNKQFPSFLIMNKHPYYQLLATVYPTGWRLKAINVPAIKLTEEYLNWNQQILKEMLKTQGEPSYVSTDRKVYYWLYNTYIVQYKETDTFLEINFIQIY